PGGRHVARAPFPRRPEDVQQQGFHEAGRHVDDQPLDVPVRHRHQRIAHQFEAPASYEWSFWFENVPKHFDEAEKVFLRIILHGHKLFTPLKLFAGEALDEFVVYGVHQGEIWKRVVPIAVRYWISVAAENLPRATRLAIEGALSVMPITAKARDRDL